MPPTPASPPKRMTRARAKAVEEKKDATRPVKQGASSTRGTSKTVNQRAAAEVSTTETSETKRSTRTKTTEVTPRLQSEVASAQASSKSTRGRPRKPTADVDITRTEPMTSKAATATRTRAATAPKATNYNEKAGVKKKVAFQEDLEADKENIVETAKAKKATAAGLKPAAATRQTASARANQKAPAKSATSSKSTVKGDATRVKDTKPLALSPKKDSQVAKVVPESEEDELSGEKTPLKPLRKSPQKPIQVLTHISPKKPETHSESSVKEHHADQPDELHTAPALSPTKSSQGAMFASPPKRFPASPFKDAFKFSPKKLGGTPSKPGTTGPSNNLKDSVLMKSPKKFNFGGNSQPHQDEHADLKASILQSPRRPPSPLKGFNSGSCIRVATSQQAIPASVLSTTPRKLLFSPHRSLVASSGAENSPEFSSKLQNSAAEVQNIFSSEHKSRIPIRSPPRTTAELSVGKASSPTATPQLKASETSMALADIPSLTPLANPSPAAAKAFPLTKPGFQDGADSEDELQSSQTQFNIGTPTPGRSMKSSVATMQPGPMTVLAERFMSWQGSTPDERILDQRKVERSIFSPIKMTFEMNGDSFLDTEANLEPQLYSAFEEAMAIREDPMETTTTQTEIEKEDCFRQSVVSDASQEYGDENAMPLDATLLISTDDRTMTCTPARISRQPAMVLHTVSKVPLKPAADELCSPLKIQPVRRTKSLSEALSPRADLEVQMLRQLNPVVPENTQGERETQTETYTPHKASVEGELNQTPKLVTGSGSWSVAATPARTPRADLNLQLLRGAVVFVDVHTTEGADASGIFIELLSQMGAKCVKQWNWNPRASLHGLDVDDSECGKIGITHVVFKDGGKRTMEKVREAKGVVLCVGVGWVLDCERENKWLDEADYTIDVSTVPRGGHRRRKSMEPKRLSSWNGNLFEAASSTKQAMSPSKEFLNLDTPQSRRNTVGTTTPLNVEKRVRIAPSEPLMTPNSVEHNLQEITPEQFMEDDVIAGFGSPTTPYFLHREQLTQQTCPPKQTQQLLFPLSGIIDEQPDEAVRKRLWLARRKSLQFAPKVGSPLKD